MPSDPIVNYHDLDTTAGSGNETHIAIDCSDHTDLALWFAAPVGDDPSSAVIKAFACVAPDAGAQAISRLTASGTVSNSGASVLDIDVSKRTTAYIKITTAESGKGGRLHYALFDNRSL